MRQNGDDDDNGNGIVRAEARQEVSAESVCLANLGLCLQSIAVDLREAAKRIDELEGVDRKALARRLSRELGELGDSAHEARRVIEAFWRES